MRILYYVPMIHADEELGELGPMIKNLRGKIYSERAIKHDESAIKSLWEVIRSWVFQMIPDVQGLIIYQDGIPTGPREKIKELFKLVLTEHSESPLFRFTKELIDRGGVLEGTEDIHLLIKRVAIYKEIYQAATQCHHLSDVEEFIIKKVEEQDDLVFQSDQFIARRINETLPENGKGILFMGYRHRVDEELVKMRKTGLLSAPIKIHKFKLTIEKATFVK